MKKHPKYLWISIDSSGFIFSVSESQKEAALEVKSDEHLWPTRGPYTVQKYALVPSKLTDELMKNE